VSPGAWQTSILRGSKHLKDVGLLSDRTSLPYVGFTPAEIRHAPYPELWETCLRKRWYDFRLVDESFFQFRRDGGYSLTFYDAPVRAAGLDEFGRGRYGEAWEELRQEVQEEYEQYVGSLARDWPATPIRFDFSPEQYGACHPAAHIHFGYVSSVRLGTRRALSPEAFVLFVIRQYFPHVWPRLLDRWGPEYLADKVRRRLPLIESTLWGLGDECELHLV
jgi:hypothetical protein